MARNQIFDYTVEGTGVFPIDMLRYDSSWHTDEQEGVKIIGPYRVDSVNANKFYRETRQVHLRSNHEPTRERWISFGWKVIRVEKRY